MLRYNLTSIFPKYLFPTMISQQDIFPNKHFPESTFFKMIYPDETYPERHYPDMTFFPNQMMKNNQSFFVNQFREKMLGKRYVSTHRLVSQPITIPKTRFIMIYFALPWFLYLATYFGYFPIQ
ncbi:hypothetical protein GLOIN_2v867117 [Rhizophagus irregularis DAOM 181602=DAOM 197198]|uniref:Uncharacterized protein n=1 Tax=Rhizophagus irregularis (strain DAOM 181602 / DAOM 197198 / MUCL 43194) TaxID=747089 RepID=A0A2P4QG42_RHIID|nr:hypothetical protein GLOIN_2v867117 [Rhizophagus irregularis DAOM 181602=DAOM 197198]POG76611.1 hypothetical protein GLOIN_2v867117 [Rhizophagus irregularis DAOM 181602=DAOM 197198]|eukprot:XP_025183477.1 hypothetical protein GLOIN_2v867117 [Rhizophagus irregularis DAOM 181602=DAOM 197198]